MTASLLPPAEVQFCDANGAPLALGHVYFYVPNTLTPKDTYQDQNLQVLNTNPIALDTAGRAIIWGTGTYRQVVKDSLGNTIWDQITSVPDSNAYYLTPFPYNATGNGVADDIIPLQNAVNAAIAMTSDAKQEVRLDLAGHLYAISSPLNLGTASNITITNGGLTAIGSGWATTDPMINRVFTGTYQQGQRVTLSNLRIYCNRKCSGILWTNTWFDKAESVHVFGEYSYGFKATGQNGLLTWRDCSSQEFNTGVDPTINPLTAVGFYTDCADLTIDNCWPTKDETGFQFTGNAQNIEFINNHPFTGSTGATMTVTGTASGTGGVVRLTVNDSSPVVDNKVVNVAGIVGTTEANGRWLVHVVDATHIELIGSVYANAYVSGGTAIKRCIAVQFDAGAARVNSINNYIDTGDWVIFTNFGHTLGLNFFTANSPNLILVATNASSDGFGLKLIGNSFANNPQLVATGAGSWTAPYTIMDFGNAVAGNRMSPALGSIKVQSGSVTGPSVIVGEHANGLFEFTAVTAGLPVGTIGVTCNGATKLAVSPDGSVVAGGLANLATNATKGFFYVPIMNGAPTGVPDPVTGHVALVYRSDVDRLDIYRGGWKEAQFV